MQIDLIGTPDGVIGLMGNHSFETPVSGVIFDVAERSLTLEFGKSMETLRMNIPVGEDFVDHLKTSSSIHIAAVERERMVQASQVMLVKVSVEDEDFYYGEVQKGVLHTQNWLSKAQYAQAIHRDNLGDESSARGILYDVSPATLKYAPQLAQALAKEQAAAYRHVPNMAPPSLGPGSLPQLNVNRIPKPPTQMSDE